MLSQLLLVNTVQVQSFFPQLLDEKVIKKAVSAEEGIKKTDNNLIFFSSIEHGMLLSQQ